MVDINHAHHVIKKGVPETFISMDKRSIQDEIEFHKSVVQEIKEQIYLAKLKRQMLKKQLDEPIGAWKRRRNIIRAWSINERKIPFLEKKIEEEKKTIERLSSMLKFAQIN